MPIRITGMYSGLDTEAIISELASAQSMKKNSLVKKQISLSWKMDAWKALNTKIYSFYSKTLDNMRFQSSYGLKATKVSSSSVSVTTKNNAVNGVQELEIGQMAKMGYLTGGKISATTSSELKDLGITEGSFSVEVGGKSVKIDVTGDMKISDVVSKLQNAGLNASFDEKNQRFFVSSKKSGKEYNFHLIANNTDGLNALSKLGLLTETDLRSGEYETWSEYVKGATDYETALQAEIDKRANAYKKANDSLAASNEELKKKFDELKKEDGSPFDPDEPYDSDKIQQKYGELETALKSKEEKVKGLEEDLKTAQEALDAAGDDASEELKQDLKDAEEALLTGQSELDKAKGVFSFAKGAKEIDDAIKANEDKMAENSTYYTETEGTIAGTGKLRDVIEGEFDAKIENAKEVMKDLESLDSDGNRLQGLISKGATKIEGQDAEIKLNGATFTSESNTFDINGLEITILEENKGETITLSTGEDIDGIYDMIKNFLTEYNKLINEMDALYNADSSKGYDPLLTEEKDGLSDSEIEEWEKKIKDSILRRDQTLGNVSGAIKNVLLAGAEVNGVQMYLSQFGINTLGYFNAAENEKNAYHIYGDSDDPNTMMEEDILRSMIASDPDTVMNFFSGLSKNLYSELTKQMAGSTMSSAFTVYNDKSMKEEYDAYTEKIAKQETKLNNLMDKWYKKFSQMETAMAKMQSKNSAVSSMFGV